MSTTFISSFSKQDIINAMPAIACFAAGMSVAWVASKVAYWIFDHRHVELAEKTLTRSVSALALIAGTLASFAASSYLPYLGMAFGPILGKYSWASISLGVFGAAIGQKLSRPDYPEATLSTITPACVNEARGNDTLPSGGEAVIYGYSHCCYSTLRYAFAGYTHVAPYFSSDSYAENLAPELIGSLCKKYLVDILIENYQRQTKNNPDKPQIPIIFCIDANDNPYPVTAENILSRTKNTTDSDGVPYLARTITTHQELRRVFKLCYSKNLPANFKEMARKSFKFVKVEFEDISTIGTISQGENTKYHKIETRITKIVKVNAPWENSDWKNEWAKQKKTKPAKTDGWRKTINDTVLGNNSTQQPNKKRQKRGKK